MQKDVSLKPYNTFSINATAAEFASFTSVDELELLVTQKRPVLILGGGSNILFTKNFDGLVLKNDIAGIDVIYSPLKRFLNTLSL